MAEGDGALVPSECTQLRRANPVDQCRGGRLAGVRCVRPFVEQHPAQPGLDALDQVVALLVPDQADALLDLIGHRLDELVGVERGTDADARIVAFAVQVGGHHEALVGERVGGRCPRARTAAQLEATRLAAAHGDAVGVGVGEDRAAMGGVHRIEVERDAGAAGQVVGAVAYASDVAHVRPLVVAVAGEYGDAQRQVGGQVVGSAAEDVALVEQRGDDACQPAVVRGGSIDHAGQSRMEGQGEHASAAIGDAAVVGERAQSLQQLDALLQCSRGRRVGPAQPVGGCAPSGEFQGQAAEVHLGDLGLQVGAAGAVLELAPQPVRRAGLGAAGAAGALVGRCSAGGDGGEAGHAGALVEAGHAGQARVHHHAHAVHGERRLGDVGAQHHPAASRQAMAAVRGPARPARVHRRAGTRRRSAARRLRATLERGGSHRCRAGTPTGRRSAHAAPCRPVPPSIPRLGPVCPSVPTPGPPGASVRRCAPPGCRRRALRAGPWCRAWPTSPGCAGRAGRRRGRRVRVRVRRRWAGFVRGSRRRRRGRIRRATGRAGGASSARLR